MATEVHAERERKYDVEESTGFPALEDLTGLPGVVGVESPAEEELDATYLDTAGLDLTAHGITLRRRTGGEDAGWTLKLPVSADERQELRVPLGRKGEPVPRELLARVRAHVRKHAVTPLLRLSTTRRVRRLMGEDGVVRALLVDDHVAATPLRKRGRKSSWREWEVELAADGSPELWDALEPLLFRTGAVRSTSGSKLARGLGDRLPPKEQRPPSKLSRRATAAELLRLALRTQVDSLKEHDAEVRRGTEESVHEMRIACRRLRSTLATYRPLLGDPEAAVAVRGELQWLGDALNKARDAQVMQARLTHLVEQEPEALVLGPVRARIEADLGERYATGLAEGLRQMDDERYFRLLDALDALLDAPLTGRADRPAPKVVSALLGRELKRVERAARRADKATDPAQRDLALHDLRKAAKRLRYAAESAVPALGKPMKKLARRAKALQDVLGEHQDGVVARQLLLDLSEQACARGENAFTYGRLHAHEEAMAGNVDAAYRKALAALA